MYRVVCIKRLEESRSLSVAEDMKVGAVMWKEGVSKRLRQTFKDRDRTTKRDKAARRHMPSLGLATASSYVRHA